MVTLAFVAVGELGVAAVLTHLQDFHGALARGLFLTPARRKLMFATVEAVQIALILRTLLAPILHLFFSFRTLIFKRDFFARLRTLWQVAYPPHGLCTFN